MQKIVTKLLAGTTVACLALPAFAETITFRFNDPEHEEMRAALDEFEAMHPDIEVEMERIDWGSAREQFLREAATGAGPDVLQIAFVWPRSLGDIGSLMPLDDFIEETGVGVAGWEEFIARDLAVGPDEKVYGIPFTTDTFALVYNEDLLAAAGYDSMPTDWEAFREMSKAVHAETGKAGFGFPAGSCGTPTIWFLLNFYWWSNGHALIDVKDDGTFYMNITPEQIAEGFDYYNQYLVEGDNPKANLTICLWGSPELVEGMVEGEIAAVSVPDPVGIQIVEAFKERYPDREVPFAAAPHPADVNGSKTFFGGRMIGINANTEKAEAAWELVQFLAQPDPLFTDHYTNYVQPQRPIMQYAHLPESIRDGFSEQIQSARSWGPYGTGPVAIPFMWNAVGRAAGSVFIGEKSSEQAAQELHDAIAAELEKNQ